ncbi:MAG: FAD-dependent oxidoreductase [Meiothermus sp.]|nr:FAD-dependent oxidoreductase [Meiothermus sp.]
MSQAVAVLGAGVVGLSSAITLARAGYRVEVLSRETSPHTTSDRAAAWFAPLSALGSPRWKPVVLDSLEQIQRLSQDPRYGVRALPVYELGPHPLTPPAMPELRGVRDLEDAFPAPWNHGFAFDSFQMDVPTYMARLTEEAKRLGIEFRASVVSNFDEFQGSHRVIVNCTGLGARGLGDPAVYPIRGQVVRVSRPEGFPDAVVSGEGEEVTYVVPRLNDIILGGTYHHHAEGLEPDPSIAEAILERCLRLRPELAESRVLEHRVGLRPGRSEPRLELEPQGRLHIIHNYGHGSTGHTLAWGCARRVLALVEGL